MRIAPNWMLSESGHHLETIFTCQRQGRARDKEAAVAPVGQERELLGHP